MARKNTTLKLPHTRTFTISDIFSINREISTQTIRKHVRTATDSGTLLVVGRKLSCGRGRPCFLFEKA